MFAIHTYIVEKKLFQGRKKKKNYLNQKMYRTVS